jgi:ParB/RepB/Spo0J family partition protein
MPKRQPTAVARQRRARERAITDPQSSFRMVPTHLLLEPRNPARETFDEGKLNELIESIRALGEIIEPLIVHPEGDNFRVDAGHRRLLCARTLLMSHTPCLVRFNSRVSGEAMKLHENYFREDLNAAEEARYLSRLLEADCGGDVDNLVELVKRPRDYIEGRLLLMSGDPAVLEALAGAVISIGAAHELNRVENRSRRLMLLEAAAQGGASVRMVRDWRIQGNFQDAELAGLAVGIQPPERPAPAPEPYRMTCFLCGGTGDTWELEMLHVHQSCRRAAARQAEAAK